MNDASIDQLLAELSRLHSNDLRLGDDDSRRGELIQLLLEKVRQEYTDSKLRQLTRDEAAREVQRLQRIAKIIERRIDVINQIIAERTDEN